MAFSLSKNSYKNMKGIDTKLIEVIELAITKTKVDFGIPSSGGLRTREEQYDLYINGSSRCDGYNIKSRHQSGKAVDVFAYVDGKASWEVSHLSQVANAILQSANELGIKLVWGGLFNNFIDMPHFELLEDQ